MKKLQRVTLVLTGLSLVAATVTAGPAGAGHTPKPQWSTTASKALKAKSAKVMSATAEGGCLSWVGWSNADGTLADAYVTPGKPPKSVSDEPFNFPAVRNSATWYLAENNAGTQLYYYGLFLQGANLYRHSTILPDDSAPRPTTTKVGSGWASFKSIATSNAVWTSPRHTYLYGLNSNGSLYRYQRSGTAFRALGSFGGFKAFKAMTVISETATYDTLLMTTNAGALYTIRIPVTATAKPIVKLIRGTGFAAYESLSVQGCGTRGGSLVVGVDHDTDTADQYAISKANGAGTAITAYGKIPTTFTGNTAFSITTHYDQLVGE